MKKLFINIIGIYQAILSPDHGIFRRRHPTCCYAPTCSEYAGEAFQKKPFFTAAFLSVKRIARCHPWAKGGYDPLND